MQVSDIVVQWTPEDSGRVASIQIQSRIVGTAEWTEQAAAYDPFVGVFRFTSNAPATDVEVRCRYRMVTGLYGPWLSDHIVTSAANVIYDTISGIPTSLNDINETQGGKLDGVEYGATYGAPGSSPVGNSDAMQVLADIAAARETIADLESLIGIIPADSTVAQEITKVAAAEIGGNLLPSSDLASGTAGWGLVTNTPDDFDFATDNAEFVVPGEHYLGLLCRQPNGDFNAAVASDWVPITSGSWVQISAWLASRECTAAIRLQWGDGGGGYLSDAADSATINGPRGWENLDGWQRVWTKAQAPDGARFARLVLVKGPYLANPANDLSWAMLLRPMLALATADQTVPSNYQPSGGGAGLARASARIEEVSTAAAGQTAAIASRTSTLEASYNGLSGRVSTSEGAISNINGKVGAYWQTTAVSPSNRAQLTIFAEANGSAGVDIVGDVTVSGNLVVDGTIRSTKIKDYAVTVPWYVSSEAVVYSQQGIKKLLLTCDLTKAAGASMLEINAQAPCYGGDAVQGYIYLELWSGSTPIDTRRFRLKVDGNNETWLPFLYQHHFFNVAAGNYQARVYTEQFGTNISQTDGLYHMLIREYIK